MTDKPKKSEEDKHLEMLIERTYNHPDISPWHVREALRQMHERLMKLEAKK